jgi:Carboxypeptidase regulatory-like domain/TonB-dependent Receptor Plug Domain/TonB dependent receptor
MNKPRTLRQAAVAVLILMAFLFQETWALAGVTGNIAGVVRDSKGAPVAGASVKVVSPSQAASTTTDSGGHFIILSLAPDTYTLTVAKTGYAPTASPGEVIFADQTQQVSVTLNVQLATIAHVTSTAAGSLVKSGVGGDLYNVSASQAAAAAPLGGGSNLNNAYSALASVPGVQTNVGGAGWDFNAAYVRGQNSYYTGFEYDGIPINRAFDNYNGSTESSLGLQELQVYTGGGPSSVASAGTAGFINQVIKTGTFPGFASASLGLGAIAFYHSAQVEVGGSTPDRNFSYYVGLSGNNQDFRIINAQNGANLMTPGGQFSGEGSGASPAYNGCNFGQTPTCQGVKSTCPLQASVFGAGGPAGCWAFYSGTAAAPSNITDREDVINLHVGIPKKNGLRDDIQLLYSASALNNYTYSSPNDIGAGYNQFSYDVNGAPYAQPVCNQPISFPVGLTVKGCVPSAKGGYFPYADSIAYNLPFGSVIGTPGHTALPGVYMAPGTPQHQFDGPIPLYDNSLSPVSNDTGIAKLQYTYALSTSAYLRIYGYSFYSDWLQESPLFGSTEEGSPSVPSPEYQLYTHSAGGALEFNDQINDQNLLGVDYNYTTANVTRFNNSSAIATLGNSPIGFMSKNAKGGGYTCYDPASGNPEPCLSSAYYDVALGGTSAPNVNPTWRAAAYNGPAGFGIAGSPAQRAGATWDTLWQGNASGSLNNVGPRFSNAALSDQFRPNDKFLINASVRYDNFTYDLPDSNTAGTQFYASQTANYTCVLASDNQVLQNPLQPGQAPPTTALYVNGDCNQAVSKLFPTAPKTGWVHPNGTTQDGVAAPNFTANSPSSYSLNYWQPRFSATYTVDPLTVIRASAGRFTQPPISASVQYLGATGDDRSVWNQTMDLGFYSPFHPIPGISSAQYDLSLEQRFKGTDMSFKLTPFYTWVNDWQQQTFIGAGFVTQVPVGVNRDYGVEFQFNKGDFSKNGLSGQFAFTYTNSKIQFQNEPLSTGGTIPNATIQLNQVIAQYNQLTKGGGGSACYQGGKPVSCSTPNSASFDTIQNPYYNKPVQGELDPNGWYNPYTTAISPNQSGIVSSYISPFVSSLILNYRHDRFSVTPSLQFQGGGYYGSPLDVNGYDPRTCAFNSAGSDANGQQTGAPGAGPPITSLSPKTNPLQCNYLSQTAPGLGQFSYLYIPDPQTGHFSAMGSYMNPNIITGNLAMQYQASSRITLNVTGTNLFHACFGGQSEPWTAATPPGPYTCGYTPAGGLLNTSTYPSNFYNGTGINDFAANKVHPAYSQSYVPALSNNGAIGGSLQPVNVYFNAQIRI